MDGHGLMGIGWKHSESRGARRIRWSVMTLPLWAACLWLGTGLFGTARSEDKPTPNEIRASRFVVVDNTGRARATFGLLEDGAVGMDVHDAENHRLVSVRVDHSGMPFIGLQNRKGEALLELAMLDDKNGAFIMRDADGNRRLGMVVTETGLATLRLYDTKKRARCAIALDPNGDPSLVLSDRQGNVRARLTLDEKETCALDFLNSNEQGRIVLQVDEKGEGGVAVFGSDGKTIWSASRP